MGSSMGMTTSEVGVRRMDDDDDDSREVVVVGEGEGRLVKITVGTGLNPSEEDGSAEVDVEDVEDSIAVDLIEVVWEEMPEEEAVETKVKWRMEERIEAGGRWTRVWEVGVAGSVGSGLMVRVMVATPEETVTVAVLVTGCSSLSSVAVLVMGYSSVVVAVLISEVVDEEMDATDLVDTREVLSVTGAWIPPDEVATPVPVGTISPGTLPNTLFASSTLTHPSCTPSVDSIGIAKHAVPCTGHSII